MYIHFEGNQFSDVPRQVKKNIGNLILIIKILKECTIYGHDSDYGHVTWDIYINLLSPCLCILQI